MIIIELFVLRYKNKIIDYLQKKRSLEYIISSFFGILPGCVGTFVMDSLYMAGLLGFGGIIAVMIATSGDEAFILISLALKGSIPMAIIVSLTIILFLLGIGGAYLADYYRKKTNMEFCEKCEIVYHKKNEFKFKHFVTEHIYKHIIKKHIWQIFLWVFGAIFVIGLFNDKITLVVNNMSPFSILVIASLIALLPISGPNVFLIMLFAQGTIPLSILIANSIIQDGHGLLPIMGFSVKDAIKIKTFNFVFGFVIGLILLLTGI
jgi:hypothetical protein